jgi:hypothetical protein
MARKRQAVSTAPKPKGLKSRGRRRLTDAQVLSIVERYRAGGVTQKELGGEHGVTQVCINAILKGRSYVWLTGIGVEKPKKATRTTRKKQSEAPQPLALAA